MEASRSYELGMPGLVQVVQELSLARDLATVQDITRRAARALTGADGATFVLRDNGNCFYADEDAIAPLWKGLRFPLTSCISGWAMLNRRAAVIEDIYADDRIPHDAYRPTFVKSLAMVPIRSTDPLGAIGNYWATRHQPTDGEVALLQALADSTAVAMENIATRGELARHRAAEETARTLLMTDELTGLGNRRGFLARAGSARDRAAAEGATSALLFVDLDGLKFVNDTFGHGAGDDLIRAAAAVLDAGLRTEDIVARWGGDEFVAFLPGVPDPDGVRERLLASVARANRTRPGPPVALSVGVIAVAAGDPRPFDVLIAEADEVMYADKHRSRPESLVLERTAAGPGGGGPRLS